jgi:hypothetical protein
MAPETKASTRGPATDNRRTTAVDSHQDWVAPPAQNIPHPTYAPAGFALGVSFVLFGLATSYLFCAAGAVLMAIALKSWIGGMANGE